MLKRPKPPPGEDPAAAQAPLHPGELVPDQLAEILSPDFPGERLLVCLNPRLRAERARKREELLQATERILEGITAKVRRRRQPLRGRDAINRLVGREANRKKVEQHFAIEVTDEDLRWSRKAERIAAEARAAVYTQIGLDKWISSVPSLGHVRATPDSLHAFESRIPGARQGAGGGRRLG